MGWTVRPGNFIGGWGSRAASAAGTDRRRGDAESGAVWLRDFFPGYFALVMGTGIVAVAARLTGRDIVAWGRGGFRQP